MAFCCPAPSTRVPAAVDLIKRGIESPVGSLANSILPGFGWWQCDQLSFQQLTLAGLIGQPLEFLERQQGLGRAHSNHPTERKSRAPVARSAAKVH